MVSNGFAVAEICAARQLRSSYTSCRYLDVNRDVIEFVSFSKLMERYPNCVARSVSSLGLGAG